MKKVLFIDRDGTLIWEPPNEQQIDSLEVLEFIPNVFRNLYNIQKYLDYELVMVTNQDGLGSVTFPEHTFWPAHEKMIKAFANEGVTFGNIHIDRTRPEDNAPTRKPGIGMLSQYFDGDYDLANSIVIGDRLTDVELAKNLGAKAILFDWNNLVAEMQQRNLYSYCLLSTTSWDEVFELLSNLNRKATVNRKTSETDIFIEINLAGKGNSNISTGLRFFDHMLDQIGRHSGCDLTIQVKGDLDIDEHHTIEDTGIALGEAIRKALGDKRGIERYGYCLPMDESLAQVALDFGGRPWLVWEAAFKREFVGDMPTEMFKHFFKSVSDAALCNLNIKAEGENEHHKIEGIFKAFARALKMAIRKDPFQQSLPSTKGTL
jgi:imidazoleglycerol-phosphate dehydratase (EC 4.2.1.19)/histidinol-phosphate phosphatase (EC 3.1.3.15)